MSGSSNTGYNGGSGSGSGSSSSPSDCDIAERVPLNSPQPAVLAKLKAGMTLDVALTQGPPQSLVAQIQKSGEIAGSLTPKSLARLLQCMRSGNVYIADVVTVKGGLVEVEIRRQ